MFQLGPAFAQQNKTVAVISDSILVKADRFIGYDNFGACYFIKDNVFYKKKDTLNWQYKSLSLGKIAMADIDNPLNIVLFYESFNTVILLDNQLNETQKISFSENTVPIVAAAVGLAFGNRLWVYNSLSQQIGLFDYLKSDFTIITPPFPGNLKYYSSDFNNFHWVDEKMRWFRCTVYGKVTSLGKVPDFEQIQTISDSELLFKRNNSIYLYKADGNKTTLIDFGKKTFKSFHYKDQILSIFTANGITNYKIITP